MPLNIASPHGISTEQNTKMDTLNYTMEGTRNRAHISVPVDKYLYI